MIDLYKQFETMYPQKAKETMRSHCIIHYVSYKPWQNRLSLGQDDFERIARKTLICKANIWHSRIQKIFAKKNIFCQKSSKWHSQDYHHI